MENTTQQYTWHGIDLEALRQVMDKPADEAVLSVFKSTSMDYLRSLLMGMAKNDSVISDELPKPIYDFIKGELAYPFSALDIKLFNQTREIWKAEGMKFIFVLLFRALPYTYMAEKPAKVLKTTKLLIEQPERRIFETAQFVFDVMDKNWWEPDNRGILSALKVRIMHASMRHVIMDNQQEGVKWNDAWGKPISQEDLVATNQVFSLEFFKGMSMLGNGLDADQQHAWFHTWKTIGRIMGVRDELICSDVKEAWTLQHAVYRHLFNDETVAGIPLCKALVETMDHFHLPLKLTLLLMRRMLADDLFPECFDRMLGPTYASLYPEVFIRHENPDDKNRHEALLRGHFHEHLQSYYHTLNSKKNQYQRIKPRQGLLGRLINWLLKLTGRGKNQKDLIDIHIGILHDIIHQKGTETLVERLEEEMILESMSSLGGIMVSILSFHFRAGKQTGFRIPKDLQENWSLTSK